ncbi:MAG: restriction endonuclease subunit S [Candidatus Cloacimonetes bacterium]|nr:restriction endonuclease subunit S [Candidatus Cloacimonadota bacterium]MDY0366771.1 restriction endonuclease subunit S [Candidatus Syntrophosphaera sp.]
MLVKLREVIDSVSDTYKFTSPDEIAIFLNTSDIYDGYVINRVSMPAKNLPGQAKKRIRKNDILYSEIRPKNKRFAYVNDECSKYVVSTKLMVLRVRQLYDTRYIYQYLKSQTTIDYLQAQAESRSGTFPQITFDVIGEIEINIPPIETQKEIAQVLGTLDDKIELNRRMNKTLEEIAQALFKHWFIDFEFPNEEGKPYKTSGGEMVDSELGLVPKGWRLGQLKELVDNVVNRVSVSERKESMPYVPIECISPKTLCLWNSLPGVKAQSSLIIFDQGDILFGAMRPYFHKVCIAPFEGTTRTTAFVLRARPQEVGYALMLINQKKTIEHATNHSEGSTIPYAKWDNIMGCMDIVVPDKNTMLKYGALMKSFLCYMNTNVSQSSILSNNRTLLFEHFFHNS